ncbi:MAG: 3-methyladenine DNA glycosylase 2, partial [Thermoleophilia bacterium]|nr:3-methyladenine DNA glycosylase 2 [Thermoleophilia bacterium]
MDVDPPEGAPGAVIGGYLGAHGVPGTTAHAHPRHRRAQRDGDGARVVAITLRHDGTHLLETGAAGPHPGDAACAARWVGADVPITAAWRLLAADPDVGPLVRRLRLPGVPGAPDAFEVAVTTVLGQQVSTAAARTFAARLVSAAGGTPAGDLRAFPGPAAVAGLGPGHLRDAVGLTRARAETVHRLAT